jgi:hypothetical protein
MMQSLHMNYNHAPPARPVLVVCIATTHLQHVQFWWCVSQAQVSLNVCVIQLTDERVGPRLKQQQGQQDTAAAAVAAGHSSTQSARSLNLSMHWCMPVMYGGCPLLQPEAGVRMLFE